MSLEKEIYDNGKTKVLTFTQIFLIFVVILTIGLYSYNYYLSGKNNNLESEIIQKQKILDEKKQQQVLKVYNLYVLNKKSINRLEKFSKLKTFLNHLDYISNKYNLIFRGFNYKMGNLTTVAYTISDEKNIDYQKTVNFLRKYKEDKKALFKIKSLKGINTFDNKQKFEITFEIK